MIPSYHLRKQGSALISALFIMTLVTIAVMAMSIRVQVDIYRTRLTLIHDELYLASQLIFLWSADILQHQVTFTNKAGHAHLLSWPVSLYQYPHVALKGEIIDLQSRFNVNSLFNKENIIPFAFLIKDIAKLSEKDAMTIAEATHHWLAAYNLHEGKNEYLQYYLKQQPPYYPGQQLFQNISEWRLIMGVDQTVYLKLQPFITALPIPSKININTASEPILKIINLKLNQEQISALITARGEEGFKHLQEITTKFPQFPLRNITLESQYFLSIAEAKQPELHLVVQRILERRLEKANHYTVRLISEEWIPS